MTEQTALEWLKVLNSWSTLRDEPKEACEVAINALEKQIAKKPKVYTDGFICCSICDNYLITLNPNRKKESNYCDKCGQKLDWSEV